MGALWYAIFARGLTHGKFRRNEMSNTSTIITVIAGFVGTAGAGITTLVNQAKKAEANINTLVVRYEAMVNAVLKEITTLQADVQSIVPAPTPAPAPAPAKSRAPRKPESPKRNLR
jgi:hypothetical protein